MCAGSEARSTADGAEEGIRMTRWERFVRRPGQRDGWYEGQCGLSISNRLGDVGWPSWPVGSTAGRRGAVRRRRGKRGHSWGGRDVEITSSVSVSGYLRGSRATANAEQCVEMVRVRVMACPGL